MSRVSVGNLIHHANSSAAPSVLPPVVLPAPAPQPQGQPPIHRYVEHGREYYAVNNVVVYPFPCDEVEDERLDQLHYLIHDLALRQLHTFNLPSAHRPQVLDVAHGTGIWVYEVAKSNDNVDVLGIELHDRSPPREDGIPFNVTFASPVDFTESNWGLRENFYDLLRMNQLCGSVADWRSLYQTVFKYIRPGIGHVEHIEIDWQPRLMDDYELPPEAQPLIDWYKYLQEASRRFGKPIDCPDVDALMTQCGFAETNHRTIRLPLRHRALDVRDRDLSDGLKNAMCYQYDDGSEPKLFESLSMSLFTRQLGMQRIEVENWCARLREIAGTEDMPIFFNL